MKIYAFLIGLFILCVSVTSYVKFHEDVSCKKSCCPTEKSSTKTGCCGDVCSPFMKCQASHINAAVSFSTQAYAPVLEHHSTLRHFFVVQTMNNLWRPPKA